MKEYSFSPVRCHPLLLQAATLLFHGIQAASSDETAMINLYAICWCDKRCAPCRPCWAQHMPANLDQKIRVQGNIPLKNVNVLEPIPVEPTPAVIVWQAKKHPGQVASPSQGTHTHTNTIYQICHLPFTCLAHLWNAGGKWSSWWKATQTQGECANSTQKGPSAENPSTFLLWSTRATQNWQVWK